MRSGIANLTWNFATANCNLPFGIGYLLGPLAKSPTIAIIATKMSIATIILLDNLLFSDLKRFLLHLEQNLAFFR